MRKNIIQLVFLGHRFTQPPNVLLIALKYFMGLPGSLIIKSRLFDHFSGHVQNGLKRSPIYISPKVYIVKKKI